MKLYTARLSLFARKIEIALGEKGLAFERVMVPFTQEKGYSPKHPDVLAANPKGQVPVLIDGDLTLYDSTVILEYLEDAWPTPALYPAAPKDRALCRQQELFADEILLAPVRDLMHRNGPRTADPDRRAAEDSAAIRAEGKIAELFAGLDRRLEGSDFFFDAFSAADIATFMTILYSERLAGPPLTDHPALAAWYDRLSRRPVISAIVAEIAEADRELSVPVERKVST